MSTRQIIYAILSLSLFLSFCSSETVEYEADWVSLNRHTTPQWLRDGKFGIYTHWGVYSVHAMGDNATWYVYSVYNRPDSWQRKDFESKYGKLSDGVGYKDLIPMFKAEKFDAAEWADLFARSGAKFAGPVAEHHDGFAMWDSTAFASVPSGLPAPGCTTMPTDLFTTMTCPSSYTMSSGMSCGTKSVGGAGGMRTSISSPKRSLWLGRLLFPSTSTWPSRISHFALLRDESSCSDSHRSSRPALGGAEKHRCSISASGAGS